MIRFALAALLISVVPLQAGHNSPPAGTEWQVGPIINGRSSSPGMPRTITGTFEFPKCGKGSVHYVTKRIDGPFSGTVTLTYSIEASADAVFVASDGWTPGRIALHFQRKGDDWSARGKYAGYRWYSLYRQYVLPGEHTIGLSSDLANWGAVLSSGRTQALFDAAKHRAYRIGFTFGGSGNAGHGVCLSTGSAQFTIRAFTVA
jgi:hypothetical protein